jgi:L-ascorbate metabolism protein UlaG (beta-lactamase superfamily)
VVGAPGGGAQPQGGGGVTGAAMLTWVGHATLLLDLGGVRVLTDPVLTRRVGHLRRRTAAPAAGTARADVVLLSHAHADHLHVRSLRQVVAVSPGVTVVVPRGAAGYVRRAGIDDVVEVVAGERLSVHGVDLTVTRADHPAGRSPWHPDGSLPVGYVVEHDDRRLWFAGDTDLHPSMTDLGRLDLAALPIAGWWRTLGPGHLDEAGAAEALARVDAARVLPVHWGTFSPEDLLRGLPSWLPETARRFERELAARGLLDRLVRLEPGESTTW